MSSASHHVAFHGYQSELRLTTDMPLSYIDDEPFALTARRHFVLAWGAPVEEPLEPMCERFLRETVRYWQGWVKHCDVPPTGGESKRGKQHHTIAPSRRTCAAI